MNPRVVSTHTTSAASGRADHSPKRVSTSATVSIRHDVGGPDGYLARMVPFTSHGAMRAIDGAVPQTGRLPAEWAQRYREDQNEFGVVYTVYSYATPIAWVRGDGRTVIPPVGYSLTTTRHQNLCAAWLATATRTDTHERPQTSRREIAA